MTLWVFNDGSSNHRGVWHAASEPIEYKSVPAKVRDIQSGVQKQHDKDCAWHEYNNATYYSGYGYGQRKTCTCVLDTQAYSVHVGDVTLRYHDPEHQSTGRIKVLCNQVVLYGLEQRTKYTGGKYPYVEEDVGKTFDIIGTAQEINPDDLYTFEGARPPGPVCSRCVKKVAKLG